MKKNDQVKKKEHCDNYSLEERSYLLELARLTIKQGFQDKNFSKILNREIKLLPKKFLEKRAAFVTLTINNELRGCIGHIMPVQELYKEIQEDAFSAAFADSRFRPLSKQEFAYISIEISLLSIPSEISFKNKKELLSKIKGQGVIISNNYGYATFLPQVWEQLPNPEEFLEHLCYKAGISPLDWPTLEVKIYNVENFKEK